MIIYDLYIVGVAIAPGKADAPAVIGSNAVLSGSIACELLEAIGRGDLQISEGTSIVEHAQFPQRDLLDVRRQPSGALAGEDLLGLTILE
jgi:hypothetical protein